MGSVLTEHGYIGVVPTITHAEDIRAILFGGQYNYMLLSPGHESPSSYQLLGPSFLLCADMNAKLSHELHKNWINWDSIEQEIYLCKAPAAEAAYHVHKRGAGMGSHSQADARAPHSSTLVHLVVYDQPSS
jgi:hypothetical protein